LLSVQQSLKGTNVWSSSEPLLEIHQMAICKAHCLIAMRDLATHNSSALTHGMRHSDLGVLPTLADSLATFLPLKPVGLDSCSLNLLEHSALSPSLPFLCLLLLTNVHTTFCCKMKRFAKRLPFSNNVHSPITHTGTTSGRGNGLKSKSYQLHQVGQSHKHARIRQSRAI